MTPQEAAQDLINRYMAIPETPSMSYAKQVATVTVDRIIEELARTRNKYYQLYTIPFWEMVKENIQNL